MFSFQSFYTAATLFLFISIACLYSFSRKNAVRIYPRVFEASDSKLLNNFIKKNNFENYKDEFFKLKINLSHLNPNFKNVVEIDESILHKAFLIYSEKGELKKMSWVKFNHDNTVSLNSKPYFFINSKYISPTAYLLFSGSNHYNLPIKTYNLTDYYIKKNNEVVLRVINIMITIAILFISIFIYFKLKNRYSIFLFCYILFCSIFTFMYNGFTNDFWPFNFEYVSDHSLGIGLGLHLTILCVFILTYLKSSVDNKKYNFTSYLFTGISVTLLSMSFFIDSYTMVKYLLFFSLFISTYFFISYPIIFRIYRTKDAYWFNYLSIFSFVLLSFLYSAKYFSFFTTNNYIELIQKLLFLGHVIGLFIAYILINKKSLVATYLKENNQDKMDISAVDLIHTTLLSCLSEREFEVLHMIADGKKDQEIADEIFVSISTVKTHKQRIYGKLDINNKYQATQIYRQFTSKTINFISN